jgi:hypothetical protein
MFVIVGRAHLIVSFNSEAGQGATKLNAVLVKLLIGIVLILVSLPGAYHIEQSCCMHACNVMMYILVSK